MRLVGKGMGEGVSVQLGCYVRFRHQRAALKQIFGRLLAQGLSGLEVMGKCLLVCKELGPACGLLASLHYVIPCFCSCNRAQTQGQGEAQM